MFKFKKIFKKGFNFFTPKVKKGFNFWSEKSIYDLVFNTDYFK